MRPRRRRLVACLLLAPLLARCAGDELVSRVSTDKVTSSTRDAEGAARIISAYRASRGLGPVVADGQLSRAAEQQARAVAGAGRLSHGAFGERMTQFGIRGTAAENLTAGSDDVAAAIARWERSPAHNANLLLKEARRVGLARADTPGLGYGHYWALVLAQ